MVVAGFTRLDGMAEALDGCHVGVGKCLGLEADGVGVVEVQCCWTSPGRRELIMTGNLSQVSRNAIYSMKDLVQASIVTIMDELGLPSQGLSLVKSGHDLHVHIEHGYQSVKPSYQMGAIVISLVSLLIGRRPREDVILFGDVGNSAGQYSSNWTIDLGFVADCARWGYREAFVGDGTKVTDDAKAAAGVLQRDGRPLVKLTVFEGILDAIPLCFGEIQ